MPVRPRTQPRRPVGGLLLVKGSPDQLSSWARRGLVSTHITQLGPWCGVTPASERSQASAPYDDGRMALAARPLPASLRPSIGFFVAGKRAAVVVQPTGWRAVKRWLVWLPGTGVVRAPGLKGAEPADLLTFAAPGNGRLPPLHDALQTTGPDALSWLAGVHESLRLPGLDLLVAPDAPLGELIEPGADSLGRFEKIIREEAAHLADIAHPGRRGGAGGSS